MSQAGIDKGGVYAEVGIALPLEKTLYYAIPSHLRSLSEVGKRVLVPLGRRKVTGYLLEIPPHLPPGIRGIDIKEILDILDEAPLFDEGMLQFFRWIANYYLAPLGEVIKTALPPGINWESYYHVSLTQEGKRVALGHSPHRAPYVEVLQAIDPQKGSPLKRLLKDHPRRSLFFSLQKKGLISLEAKIKEGRTKVKKLTFVETLPPPCPAEPLKPRKREILSFLDGKRRVPMGELQRRFKRAPSAIKELMKRGIVAVKEEEIYREPVMEVLEREEGPFSMTTEQQETLKQIRRALEGNMFSPFLLHGVTGSGKTEVYLRAVQEALSLGKQALILVPEISLTPQLLGRFQRRLAVEMALLHSGLSPGQRYDQWRKVSKGGLKVVIGARSAIFAPCKDLGLIIVDEEHETSYKQEEGVRYNARDLALVRAKREGAVVVLGSATPSLESFYNAQRGKFQPLHLTQRVAGGILPQVDIVDLKGEKHPLLSSTLKEALAEALENGGQSLLFLNRRGFSSSVICADCGSPFKCNNCSVTLTFHAQRRVLLCHYCGYHLPALQICPHCGGGKIQLLGFGTERVEEEIRKLFPQARVARMDSDVMTRRGAYGRLLRALERGEIDILIGTQMIVKGHDFPQITLVGIISADVTLNLPDLRAAERGFQLLSQAAGRAGRGRRPGKVIIQTFLPDNYAIQRAKGHDFWGFYQEEMALRKALRYPPFTRMVNIRVSSRDPQDAEVGIQKLAKKGAILLKAHPGKVQILGPSPAPLAQIKGRYRWQLILKGERITHLQRFVHPLMEEGKRLKGVRIEVDVDPLSIL
ncbi:MAG: primosomal protein N' [Deltaproteobacteria bacterium]|nr:primosomal protein N' [Deltaproteobacteria bacterium]